jgi:hypothetical protein
MPDITISYKDESIATMSASGSKTLETGGTYCEDDIEITYVKPSFEVESLTVTPTESRQVFDGSANAIDGYLPVTVNAVSSSYIGSAVERKSESDTYRIGSNLVVPAGYYSENVVVAIPPDTYISSSVWYLDANNILVM